MTHPDRCPDCGAERSAGICPRCLIRLGIDGPGPGRSGRSLPGGPTGLAGNATTAPSVLDTIAASIGPVPRVLLRDTAPGEEPGPIVRPTDDDDDRSIRYRIDGEIARGGIGAVLKGRDPDLGRDVALKVLRDDFRDDADMVRRFVEEAQIGGQLQHPGVVPIYELGTFADRRPFFAMKLVKGHTLSQLLEDRKDSADDLPRFLSIFEAIAQTVAYAHARGVIHRDLKPSNVMVGSFGEVQVMDWGLAKVLPRGGVVDDEKAGQDDRQETVIATARSGSGEPGLSHAGSVLGTPAYMAPEQARGEGDRVDERADVFALGSILGEILTGAPAFTGRTSGEILRKAARGDTADARTRLDACGAEAELIALAQDCLAAEREDRPRDAHVVAARITAYAAGVQERLRTSERERAVAEAQAVEERKQRRLQAGLAASVLALMAMGGGGYAWNQQQKAERVARTAQAVDEALADAARLRGEAQAAPPGETTRWADARAAVGRAERLLARGETDAPLRGRVTTLLGQLDREQGAAAAKARQVEADRILIAELESVRINRIESDDPRRPDAQYAAAFRKAGLDLDEAGPDQAGKWLAARTDPTELALYLVEWTGIRRRAGRPEADWRRLVETARAADPDPWRNALRARIESTDAEAAAEFRRLADDEHTLEAQPAPSLLLLAQQLRDVVHDRERAARVLRRAVSRFPAEFWAHFELSCCLVDEKEEAWRHLTAAVAIRPDSYIAHDRLGTLLMDHGRADEAIAEFRETIRLKPDYSDPHFRIGQIQRNRGRLEEGIAGIREAIRIRPDHGTGHYALGHVLVSQGKLDEAVAEVREAIRLKCEELDVFRFLVEVLKSQGKHDEALAEVRKAIAENVEAIRVKPDDARAHRNLARVLTVQGKLEEAVAEYREAIRFQPDNFAPYNELGLILFGRGDFAGSLAMHRKAYELCIKQYGWTASSELMERAERMSVLADRLPALLKGEDRPNGAADRLALAQFCYDTKRFAAAARFWAEALEFDPKLGDARQTQHRYNAACAAALAAAGEGTDDWKPDDAARARLRGQALDWLNAERAAWANVLDASNAQARPVVAQTLQHWRVDPDLVGVRDGGALAKLPEFERAAWRSLWDGVDALLARARPDAGPPVAR